MPHPNYNCKYDCYSYMKHHRSLMISRGIAVNLIFLISLDIKSKFLRRDLKQIQHVSKKGR